MEARFLYLCLFLWVFADSIYGQEVQKWGDVTDAEWAVQSFPDDEDPHSIILFDVGESFINKQLNIMHTRHKRIKILDPERSTYTDIRIPVYNDRSVQHLRRIDAQTLNMKDNGGTDKSSISRREFYTEDSGDFVITTFTFPAVQPGSIVEYRYTMQIGQLTAMPDWTFQHGSPILHSEYTVLVPDFLSYRSYSYGFQPFEHLSGDELRRLRQQLQRNVQAASGEGESSIYRTVLKNAPAIRSESHISSVENYKNKVKYELTAYRDNSGFMRNILSTWDDISDRLRESRYFGGAISSRRVVRDTVEEVAAGLETDLEKARALYHHVAHTVQWDGSFRMSTTDRAHNILDDRSGNSAEKAFTLISLLREAGMEADPVVISTRQNGWVDWTYPNINTFNHVIVRAQVAGEIYLLDPLVEQIPFGVLFPSSLNGGGLLVTRQGHEVIPITPSIESSSSTAAMITVDPDGAISSTLRTTYSGYEAILHRYNANQKGEDDYIKESILSHIPDSEVSSHSLDMLDDPNKPFVVTASFQDNNYATAVGDMIYINPFLVERISENPYRSSVRNFPVEFNFGTSKRYVASITIPEGYEVIELPESHAAHLTERTAYSFACDHNGNTIQLIMAQFNNDEIIAPEHYDVLREYYSNVASVYNQQIVLRKVEAPSPTPTETNEP
ncbi:MAG: DUF3857 domain-containing transglutaminase family protein [Balneolaceae bacterium]